MNQRFYSITSWVSFVLRPTNDLYFPRHPETRRGPGPSAFAGDRCPTLWWGAPGVKVEDLRPKGGGFLSHGSYPPHGWFFGRENMGKSHRSKWMMNRASPHDSGTRQIVLLMGSYLCGCWWFDGCFRFSDNGSIMCVCGFYGESSVGDVVETQIESCSKWENPKSAQLFPNYWGYPVFGRLSYPDE